MKRHLLLALVALFACFQVMDAIPAYPGKIIVTQPDGTRLEVRLHGDEWGHWMTNAAGQMVRQDTDGYYRVIPEGEADAIRRQASARRDAHRHARRVPSGGAALGQRHFLVILVEFADLAFQPENTKDAFENLLNEPGYSFNGATGSARDFYYENSSGRFEPIFDVYGPVCLANDKTYYGGKNATGTDERVEEAIVEACQALDGDIDFTRYDSDGDGKVDLVFMYYAGYGQADSNDKEAIWPSQWQLTTEGYDLVLDGVRIDSYACSNERVGYGSSQGKLAGIGTVCHEFGHAMGLPDFYDTDNYGSGGSAGGLYSYSLMDNGSYNNEGRTPPYFSFFERMMLGWVDESAFLEFSATGNYEIPAVTENAAYRILTEKDGECFIIENRPKAGWDMYLPAWGMLVYHLDQSDNPVSSDMTARDLWENWTTYNNINSYGNHPCYYLVPAFDPTSLDCSYYENRIPFPWKDVDSYTPVSWNDIESLYSLSGITFSNKKLTLHVGVPTGEVDYVTIATAGTYHAGDRFTFSLVVPEGVEAPASVDWYYDDEPAGADAVTLTAGAHTIEAYLTFADGRKSVLTLEIEV